VWKAAASPETYQFILSPSALNIQSSLRQPLRFSHLAVAGFGNDWEERAAPPHASHPRLAADPSAAPWASSSLGNRLPWYHLEMGSGSRPVFLKEEHLNCKEKNICVGNQK